MQKKQTGAKVICETEIKFKSKEHSGSQCSAIAITYHYQKNSDFL